MLFVREAEILLHGGLDVLWGNGMEIEDAGDRNGNGFFGLFQWS
jgi:hypothetical protein